MDFNTLHKQRKFIMIAALVGAIGMFLPWFSIPAFMGYGGGSVNGMHDYPMIIFFAMAGAGVFAFLGNQKEMMAKNNWLGVLGCGAAAALIALFFIIGIEFKFGLVSFGFWIVLAGICGVLYFGLTMKNPNDDLKQSLSDMKKQVENKIDNDPNT